MVNEKRKIESKMKRTILSYTSIETLTNAETTKLERIADFFFYIFIPFWRQRCAWCLIVIIYSKRVYRYLDVFIGVVNSARFIHHFSFLFEYFISDIFRSRRTILSLYTRDITLHNLRIHLYLFICKPVRRERERHTPLMNKTTMIDIAYFPSSSSQE